MSEIAKLLRLLAQGDKEAIVTAVTATLTPAKFSSQLTSGHTRKGIAAYNNSNSSSGECYYGFSASISPSGESMPIPLGAMVNIPVANVDAIDLYFVSTSGEYGDLRIIEIA